jgi:hypothetical protein
MIAPDAELLKEMEQDFLAGSREYGDLAALHAISRAGRESPFPTKFLSLSEKDPDPLGVRHFQELACSAHFAQTGERLDDGWRPWLDRLVQASFARSKFPLGPERVSAEWLQKMRADGQSTEGFVAEEWDVAFDEDKELETYLQNFGAAWNADNLRRKFPELTDQAASEAAELLRRKAPPITALEFRRALPALAAELLRPRQMYIRQGQIVFKVERLFQTSVILCGTLRRNAKFADPEPPPPIAEPQPAAAPPAPLTATTDADAGASATPEPGAGEPISPEPTPTPSPLKLKKVKPRRVRQGVLCDPAFVKWLKEQMTDLDITSSHQLFKAGGPRPETIDSVLSGSKYWKVTKNRLVNTINRLRAEKGLPPADPDKTDPAKT